MPFDSPLRSDIASSFEELTATAKSLNVASDALGKFILEIEEALKPLSLGVASWVEIESGKSGDGMTSWHRDVGYDKVGKNWGIALRRIAEGEWADEFLEHEVWTFNEGPRWLRIKAVDCLPALIKKLNADAKNITKHLGDKLELASEIASSVAPMKAKPSTMRTPLIKR